MQTKTGTQGRCIFCGRPGLSKEHIFGDWLKYHIPLDMLQHTLVHHDGLDRLRRETTHNGDLFSRKVRVVCRKCNSGWMSKIQNDGKSVLVPLMRGDTPIIDRPAQLKLATWLTMVTMTAQYIRWEARSIPPSEFRAFYEKPSPINGWLILFGRFHPPTTIIPRAYRYQAFTFDGTMQLWVEPTKPPLQLQIPALEREVRHNAQSSLFVLNRFFAMTYCCPVEPIHIPTFVRRKYEVLPLARDNPAVIDTSGLIPINQDEVSAFTDALRITLDAVSGLASGSVYFPDP